MLDDTTIAIPERPGNRRADGFLNILSNPHVGLLYLLPGRGDTLRINGRATIVADAPWFDQMIVKGHRPVLAVVVEIDEQADTFAFGRTAEVLDEAKGEVNSWTLVGSTEANLGEGRLSAESPIGRALLNAKVGKPIEIETPKGSRTFVVQKLVG